MYKYIVSAFLIMSSVSVSAGNLTLDQMILRGVMFYPSVLAQQSNQDAAKKDLMAAKLRFLPNPSISTQSQQVSYAGRPSTGQPATNMSLTQPLFLDGGIIAGYFKSDAKLSAADFSLLETREDVSKRIINAYIEWIKAYLKIQTLEESVKLHKGFVGMIGRRFDQGVASGSDRDLGVSRLMQAQADLDTQRSLEQTALTSLSELVGDPIHRADLSGVIAKQASIPPRVTGIAQAQMQSVTVQRFKFEAEAAEQEAKEVRAQALPQVSLQAQRQVGNAYVPGAPGYDMYGVVVTFNPGGGLSSVAGASAAFERAKSSMWKVEVAKRELTDRLNAEYNEYEFSQLKKDSLQRSANLSSEIAASYDRQYLVGRKSWLDLMNSERERTQNKVQLAEVEGSLLGANRRLAVYVHGTQFEPPAQ